MTAKRLPKLHELIDEDSLTPRHVIVGDDLAKAVIGSFFFLSLGKVLVLCVVRCRIPPGNGVAGRNGPAS